MLESFNTKNGMEYQRLSEEEAKKRGILGRLVGIIADFKNPTRNGRRYTEELWDRTFEDPIVKEKIENRCVLGELGHPENRQEIAIEKVAICLAEMPKKGDDGKVHGVFDILDTPNGRILKTLCDYGCNIGVSSRGSGDTYEDEDGNETVDATTYEFECYDAVVIPAVKDARPSYVPVTVNESVDTHKLKLKSALKEALDRSTQDERAVMKKTLEELNIDYLTDDVQTESVDDIDVVTTEQAAENNDGAVVNELHDALKRQQELEVQVESLQKKLSVCYTKESRYSDRLGKANSLSESLEKENKMLQEKLEQLTKDNEELSGINKNQKEQLTEISEKFERQVAKIKDLEESLSGYRTRYVELKNKLDESVSSKSSLNESLSSKSTEIKQLTESYNELKKTSEKNLQEALNRNTELESQTKKLSEELEGVRTDAKIIKTQSSAKLEQAQRLVEKYKAVAKAAVDKYIVSKATSIGVSVNEIKSRLTESYSFKDIDRVVEDLQQYKLNLNSLPFATLTEKKPVKMQIRESRERIQDKSSYSIDDDVDASLLTFTN